jgi:hypothetical protein
LFDAAVAISEIHFACCSLHLLRTSRLDICLSHQSCEYILPTLLNHEQARHLKTLMSLRQVVAHAKVRPRVQQGIAGLDSLLAKLHLWNRSLEVTLGTAEFTVAPASPRAFSDSQPSQHTSSHSTSSDSRLRATSATETLRHSLPHSQDASATDATSEGAGVYDTDEHKKDERRQSAAAESARLDADLLEGDIDVDEYALRLARMSSSPR